MKYDLRTIEKAQLLKKIQQQRLDLASSADSWLEITACYDKIWQQIVSMRNYLIAGGSLLAVYGTIRHPGKMVHWSKRAWGTIKLIRSTFLLR